MVRKQDVAGFLRQYARILEAHGDEECHVLGSRFGGCIATDDDGVYRFAVLVVRDPADVDAAVEAIAKI